MRLFGVIEEILVGSDPHVVFVSIIDSIDSAVHIPYHPGDNSENNQKEQHALIIKAEAL